LLFYSLGQQAPLRPAFIESVVYEILAFAPVSAYHTPILPEGVRAAKPIRPPERRGRRMRTQGRFHGG
ncbi:MAG TPA: hypothetical protein VNA86_02215, partial [bacterium]|nr:hypothetical protein [bacterium]